MDQVMGSALAEFVLQQPEGSYQSCWQGFDIWLVKQSWGELVIAEQGAQLLHFRPAGEAPLLWCSDRPQAAPKAIRGGVPLCWPWFGDHPEESAKPAHGYARTASWQLDSASLADDGGSWSLSPQHPLCDGLTLSLQIEVSQGVLSLAMVTQNTATEAQPVSLALHSYFAISGRDRITLKGLDGCTYADKLRDMTQFKQDQPISICQRIDRVYQHQSEVELIDAGLQRVLTISKSNSASTVLWNPGDLAAEMVDIGMDQVDQFVCIETARTGDFDQLLLPPGEQLRVECRIASTQLDDAAR